MSDKYEIDIQAFAKALQSGKNLNGKDGLLTPLIKRNRSFHRVIDSRIIQI